MQNLRTGMALTRAFTTQSQNLRLPYVEAAFTALWVIKNVSFRSPSERFIGVDLCKHRPITYEPQRFGEIRDVRTGG